MAVFKKLVSGNNMKRTRECCEKERNLLHKVVITLTDKANSPVSNNPHDVFFGLFCSW